MIGSWQNPFTGKIRSYSRFPCLSLPNIFNHTLTEMHPRSTVMILILLVHICAVEFGPNRQQCGGFSEMPLPCGKKLWQARNQMTWEAAYRETESAGLQQAGVVPKYKDLLPSWAGVENSMDLRIPRLRKWFAEADEFGTMITMAVSAL
jgi:hypothetical protein